MKNHKIPKLLLVLLTFFANNLLKAQVNIEYTSVNEYAFTTKEALNFIATNASTKSFNAVFNGIIKDADGHPVVEFSTTETAISPGANIFTPLTLSLAGIQYSNMDIAEIEMSSGSYPSGNYTLCLWMTCVSSDCNDIGASYSAQEPKCIPIHIENPTPLILATPENEAEIEETRPLYTWIPPTPVAGSANLNYTMILVEMMEGQTKADALTQNRPLIEMESISNPSLMHPSNIPELEKGKWYAWQVYAFVGKTEIAKSEQWKFKIKNEEKKINRFFDLNQSNISEIPKIKKGEKLFFIIENGMLEQPPVFMINLLNGKAVYPKIVRVTKDSTLSEFDEFSSDLSHNGFTKYAMDISYEVFNQNATYQMQLVFNDRKTLFRFEIID